LVALILFGSRARGDATPDSDWDVLLLADNLPVSPFRRSRFVYALLPDEWRYQLSILCHSTSEWFSRVTPLALDIALDGIILYDNSQGTVSTRLADLRQKLNQMGLKRQAIGNNDWLWFWQSFPGLNWQINWEETA
ncbi:MAG: nucleotidyltransferase domain-containing protein, partial [Anaerolineales bacterium]|nr:nucleotidyltransferase domain-containing protein [Anaerolineales bacterium]